MKFSKPLIVIIIFLAPCLFTSCINIAGEWRYQEIERVKSPDGVVDAVFVRGGGGATTAFDCSVFIVPSGTPFDEKSPFFSRELRLLHAEHWENLKLVWRGTEVSRNQIQQSANFQIQ